jgi:hypothetical protein
MIILEWSDVEQHAWWYIFSTSTSIATVTVV